jgi:magnesium chelatase family protein
MLAAIASATLNGAIGRPVSVEVHVSNGLPGFTIVGLPDAAVREARDRVRAAVLSSGLPWPLRRVTVNLAPSGVRKGGAGLDLPIAVGLLVATGEISPACTEGLAFCGELGLNGSLRHVPGMIALADATAPSGLVVPLCDVREAALVRGELAHGVDTLAELARVLRGQAAWPPPPPAPAENDAGPVPDLSDVRGQTLGRRALEVAAAGPHHLLMIGPPGSGKTMLAERLPGLLPPLSPDEALTVTRVHSAAGCALPAGALVARAPFRAPHHQASIVSLVGGGSWSLRPGEVSLATHGVLFLDELGEFPVPALEALRQPLEEGVIRVSRAGGTVTFPAAFLLVAAMNPCPCGEGVYLGACACTAASRARYRRRLSAPLLDRFDLVVPLARPDPVQLLSPLPAEPTADVAARVAAARARADDRKREASPPSPLRDEAAALLASKLHAGELSARGLAKVTAVARTLADLSEEDVVSFEHVSEALSLRSARAAVLQ